MGAYTRLLLRRTFTKEELRAKIDRWEFLANRFVDSNEFVWHGHHARGDPMPRDELEELQRLTKLLSPVWTGRPLWKVRIKYREWLLRRMILRAKGA